MKKTATKINLIFLPFLCVKAYLFSLFLICCFQFCNQIILLKYFAQFGLYLKLMKRLLNYLLFLKTGSQAVLPVLDGMEHGLVSALV